MKPCKDCVKEGNKRIRPTPYPGPRCATHHRIFVKEQKKRSHENMVVKTYALEPGDYNILYTQQVGRCAICLWATGKARRLAVDHDHKTGRVRGLLCGPCNQFIGRMGDSPAAFLRAAAYLGGIV